MPGPLHWPNGSPRVCERSHESDAEPCSGTICRQEWSKFRQRDPLPRNPLGRRPWLPDNHRRDDAEKRAFEADRGTNPGGRPAPAPDAGRPVSYFQPAQHFRGGGRRTRRRRQIQLHPGGDASPDTRHGGQGSAEAGLPAGSPGSDGSISRNRTRRGGGHSPARQGPLDRCGRGGRTGQAGHARINDGGKPEHEPEKPGHGRSLWGQ